MASATHKLPLFTKFALGISLTVLLFGALNVVIVQKSVSSSLNDEFERRGSFIAKALAEQAVPFILANDLAGLNMLINEIMSIDSSIYYSLLETHDGHVLAHSFSDDVPAGLLMLNFPPSSDAPANISIRDINQPELRIRDFSVAVMGTHIGIARVGILENEIRNQLSNTLNKLWLMVGVFFILGLIGALFFSYTIATPLEVLSRQSAMIDIKTIQAGLQDIRKSTSRLYYRLRRTFRWDDEIDSLYLNYTNMLERLEQTHHTMNQLQQNLMQSEKMAALGTLTAGIAHEVNNPLAGMRIGLNRIAKRPEDVEQIKEYTALMQHALGRVEQVIKDLLTYSRNSHFEFETVDACDIISKTVKMAQYRIKSHRISIDAKPEACNSTLFVSANRIEQVFLNIIINAIDSILEKMELISDMEGIIKIEVEENATHAVIIISDNGMGMDESLMNKIFDPFFTTKKVGEGTGLGLSVSYQIVKDHGGDIQVSSTPGQGSRFTVLLAKQPAID